MPITRGAGGDSLFGTDNTNSLIPGMGGQNITGMPKNFAGSNVGTPTNNGLITPSFGTASNPGLDYVPKLPGTDLTSKVGVPNLLTPALTPSGTDTGATTLTAASGGSGVPSFGGSTTIPGTNMQGSDVASLLGFAPPGSTQASTLISQLDNLFGKGVGQVFYNFLAGGAGYNPQVAQALMNANDPNYQRQIANIKEAFGASGDRYSSPAAIGIGDFSSSYALGQQAILANLFNQSVDRYSNMFGGILDTAHLEQANKTSIWDVLSGLLGIGSKAGLGGALGSILGKGGAGGSSDIPIQQIANLLKKLFGGGTPSALPGGSVGINSGGPVQATGAGTYGGAVGQLPPFIPPIPSIPGSGPIQGGNLNPTVTGVDTSINFDPNNPFASDMGNIIAYGPDGSVDWNTTLQNMTGTGAGGTDNSGYDPTAINDLLGLGGSGDTAVPTSNIGSSDSGSSSGDSGSFDPSSFISDWSNYSDIFGGGGPLMEDSWGWGAVS